MKLIPLTNECKDYDSINSSRKWNHYLNFRRGRHHHSYIGSSHRLLLCVSLKTFRFQNKQWKVQGKSIIINEHAILKVIYLLNVPLRAQTLGSLSQRPFQHLGPYDLGRQCFSCRPLCQGKCRRRNRSGNCKRNNKHKYHSYFSV